MYDQPAPPNVLAVFSLVLGCISLLTSCLCHGLPFNLAGIVLGIVALVQIDGDPAQGGRGLAIGGIVTSAVGAAIAIALFLLGLGLSTLAEAFGAMATGG